MKTILIPTDFSECSATAYNYAVMMAEKSNSEILLLHILDIPQPSQSTANGRETTLDTHYMMEMMKLTKFRMKKIRNGKTFKNVNVKEIIEVGSIPERILNAVKKYKADMIIMGSHGVNGIQEKFIGTNAERIVRDVEIPVLTVKHPVKNPKIGTIVFATDFSKETELVLPAISNIADMLHSRLILTKIVTPNKFETSYATERQIEVFRKKSELYTYSTNVYYANSKEEGIRQAAEISGADVIALGTHGRHGLAHFFRGSIAEDVVSHASLPVLTVNFHKKFMKSPAKIRSNNKIPKYETDLLYQIPSV